VQTTLREANDRGYECLLVEDATESYFPEFKRVTLEMVRAQGGIVGWTAKSSAVLKGLEGLPVSPAHNGGTSEAFKVLRQVTDDPGYLATLDWQPFRPGISIVRIYGSGDSGASASLLRYQPDAKLPRHTHAGYEHIYVISGSQRDENGTYGAGDLLVSAPGSSHSIQSQSGCVVLGFWERPAVFE
jgi:hypothetical protein